MPVDDITIFQKYWWLIVLIVGLIGWAIGLGWKASKLMNRVEVLEANRKKQHHDVVYIVLAIYAIVEALGTTVTNADVMKARNALQAHITQNQYDWDEKQ